MSMVPVVTPSTSITGFWSIKNNRPDSIAGKAVLLAGGAFLAYNALNILEFVSKVVWGIVNIGIATAIIAGVAYVLIDGKLVRLIDFAYQMGIRNLMGQFVAVFPIDVMKERLRKVDTILENVTERLEELRGARVKAQKTLDQFITQRDTHDSRVEMLALHPSDDIEDDQSNMARHASAAERREGSIERFTKLVAQMDLILKILNKVKQKARYIRDDIDDNITFTEQERKALQAATGAIRSIKSIINGGDMSAQLYDMALEAANQQAADRIGEIEQFLVDTKDVMRDFDLQQYASVESALQRLQSREGGSSVLNYRLGQGKVMLEHKPGEVVDVLMPSTHETNVDINALLRQ